MYFQIIVIILFRLKIFYFNIYFSYPLVLHFYHVECITHINFQYPCLLLLSYVLFFNLSQLSYFSPLYEQYFYSAYFIRYKYLSTILVEYLQSFKNLSILFGGAVIIGKQVGIVKILL